MEHVSKVMCNHFGYGRKISFGYLWRKPIQLLLVHALTPHPAATCLLLKKNSPANVLPAPTIRKKAIATIVRKFNINLPLTYMTI